MARALSQILTELNSVYNPQKDVINSQIANLDPQMEAENKGLEAQKADSFSQITAGANRRGILFSGIPLQEQASYLGSSFLPAVANLKAKYAQQRFNLQDALAKITQDQYKTAYGLQADELNREAAERAARAAGGGGGGIGGFGSLAAGGGGGGGAAPKASAGGGGVDQQRAYNAVKSLFATNNQKLIDQTVRAITASANRGNAYDKYKLQVIATLMGQKAANQGRYNQQQIVGSGLYGQTGRLSNNARF